jgi:hypothetical protein
MGSVNDYGASRNDTPFSAPSRRAAGEPSAGAAHRCFIGKPRKPCCGHEMKAALVVLTGRHSQQQIACLPVVPIGKQAQMRNVVVCHLSVGRCEYAFRSRPANGSPRPVGPAARPATQAAREAKKRKGPSGPVASYSAGRDIAAESEPSTGTKLDIAATDQIRPIATTTAIPTSHARICIPSR